MNRKKSLVGIGLIAALMALTGWLLFRDQPVTRLLHTLGQLRPGWLLLGLALMLAFVGCEATCSHLILATPSWAFMSAPSPRRPPADSPPRSTTCPGTACPPPTGPST